MSWRILNGRAGPRQAAAIDRAIARDLGHDGCPIQHTEAEVTRTGSAARRVPLASITTESFCDLRQHSGDGRYAIRITPEIAAVHGRVVTVDDDGDVEVTIDARQTHAALPGSGGESDPWERRPPRDGIPGRAQAGGRVQ